MIELKRVTDVNSEEYVFVEKLLVCAFPNNERRDLDEFRSITNSNGKFFNNIILDDRLPVGLITYWKFDGFFFFEHFATMPEYRNKGIGKRVFDNIKSNGIHPIVLETEFPVDDLTKRRIGFYERQGLKRWSSEYFQPPYRKSDGLLKMCVLTYGNLSEKNDFERIKTTIYKEVYHYNG